MTHNNTPDVRPAPEQIHYANLLFSGSWYALLIMLITHVIYVTGLKGPYIPLQKMPLYWTLPVEEYLQRAEVPNGWAWIHLAGRSDFLNFSGIVLLLSMSLICPLILLSASIRRSDRTFLVLLALQLLLLYCAASGVFSCGSQ